jgi:hypothetical protein
MKAVLLSIATAIAIAIALRSSTVSAELENQVFTSTAHEIRVVVPRGWRATDQPSYPGLLLWMLRGQPEGKIVLTAEPFTRAVYCGWPVECRTSGEDLPNKLACSLRDKLEKHRIRVGPVQAGPKENDQAGMPSVWFDLDDTKQFLRQAVALHDDRVVSLVLSAPSAEARTAHARSFEQALRTLRPLTAEELGTPTPAPGTPTSDAGVTDGALPDAGASPATFESAPVAKIAPVGPCTRP